MVCNPPVGQIRRRGKQEQIIQKQPLKCVNAQPEPDGQRDCHNRRKKQSDGFICPKPLLLHTLVQQKPDSSGDRCHNDDHQNQPDGIFCDHIFLDEGFHKGLQHRRDNRNCWIHIHGFSPFREVWRGCRNIPSVRLRDQPA